MTASTVQCAHSEKPFPYSIETGFNVGRLLQMHERWTAARNEVISTILQTTTAKTQDELYHVLIENNLEDASWDWCQKAMFCKTPDYEWFYLIIEDSVQAACIVYHPKDSRSDGESIFYVDYIATAIWNRDRPGYKRRFAGLASILLSHCVRYALENLPYRPGFALHSLPKAEKYYVKIGMIDFGLDAEKEDLRYFEADASTALGLIEGSAQEVKNG